MHPTEKTRSFFVGESHDDPFFEAMALLLFMWVKGGLFCHCQRRPFSAKMVSFFGLSVGFGEYCLIGAK
jgi:hypothetical protein